jgi:hypothetical protein
MIKFNNIVNRFIIMLGILLACTISIADSKVVMKGVFNSTNIEAGYIVANDMKFSVDNATRVYDANRQLRSLKSLKPGQQLEMQFRDRSSHVKNVSDMVLDKITYFTK